jgi:ABC-type Fe3+-hydroxamate transport system substrate-binding protein
VKRLSAFALLLVFATAACSSPHSAARSAVGTTHARLVALMPSLAEDLYAIGAGPQVVAVSSFTDDARAKKLPRVADFTSVDTERIVTLHPDVVIGIPAQSRLVAPLRRAGIDVVLLPDDTYDEIFVNLRKIGALAGRQTQAQAVIVRLTRRTMQLHARTRAFTHHPSVFVVLGSGPVWTAGATSYIASLIRIAGGVNAADDLHTAYGEYSPEALLRAQPDAIVTDPAIHLGAVLDREPWRSLHAVENHRIFIVDPAAMIERPGPHYNEGIHWLLERLIPLAT